jgi:hypothetical protein
MMTAEMVEESIECVESMVNGAEPHTAECLEVIRDAFQSS